MITQCLFNFVANDWPRFKSFWFRGLWAYLPFVIISKRKLANMHYDVSDHAVHHTVMNFPFQNFPFERFK